MEKHKLFRWAIVLIIILLAFFMGVKIGEYRVLFGGYDYYGYHMGPGMMWNGYGGYGAYGYPAYMPMMGGWYYYPTSTSAVPVPPQNATTTPYYYGPGWMMRGWYAQ